MSDKVKISDLSIQINFPAWERFNLEALTNDGVVLFQYLVFHCQNVAEWTHSDNDIKLELGIKRSRLNTLRDKFLKMGILETRVTLNQYDNKITAYRLLYSEIAKPDNLKKIYREKTPSGIAIDLAGYSRLYRQLVQDQPAGGAKPKPKSAYQQTSDQYKAQVFAIKLEELYASRLEHFNSKQGAGKKIAGAVKFSPKHIQSLANVIRHFDNDEYVRNAFVAFIDELFAKMVGGSPEILTTLPRSPLNYFLSYSNKVTNEDEGGDFAGQKYAMIWRFGDFYAARYTKG
ncbi:hypothetical protein ACFPMF_15505 [Larkinella bovis]|uniref:Helix-turn-helix domain-containing protein n=1 Tax=Larkinella bovis TaxID=683041 RepID=A0ABW0IBF2_9BACT